MLVLSMMFALSLLAAMALLSSHADLLVAGRTKAEREGFYAAQAGMERALASLAWSRPSLLSGEVFHAPWTDPALPPVREDFDGWEISWRAFPLPDTGEGDGDPATPVVLFNRLFGYPGSPFTMNGYPVFQLNVLAERGGSRKALTASVTPVCVNPVVEAALTVAGEVVFEGEADMSSRKHFVDGPLPLPDDPLDVLDPGATLSDIAHLPPPGEGPLEGMYHCAGIFSGPLDGEGVLVLHNPRFRPRAYEASRLAVEEGVFTADYDPAYSHLDPECQPASFELLEGGEFHGLVVTDSLGAFFDEATVVGAVVSLSRSPEIVRVEAPLSILFSRRAVEEVGHGPLVHRLDFKALGGVPEGFP